MNVLVVGAGPSGLTAALELARHGIKVDIVDRRQSGSGFSRAVGILPHTLELLEPSGVSQALIADGLRPKTARFFNHDRKILEFPVQLPDLKYGFLLALPQDRTEHHLRQALEKLRGNVRYGIELTQVTGHGDRVEAIFSDGKTQTYSHVIGADGIHSTVRQQAGIDYPGYDLEETWSIADLTARSWVHPDAFCAFKLSGSSIAVAVPMAPDRYRLISNTPDTLAAFPLPITPDTIHREGTFTISVRQASTYSRGRIYLVGDAAHCHSPVGGRGMNLGIADAHDLAARFANGNLDGYSATRHAEGQKIIQGSEAARRFITAPSPLARFGFISVAKSIQAFPPLKKLVTPRVLGQ